MAGAWLELRPQMLVATSSRDEVKEMWGFSS